MGVSGSIGGCDHAGSSDAGPCPIAAWSIAPWSMGSAALSPVPVTGTMRWLSGRIRVDGEAPRRMSRPVRLSTSAEGSALIRMTNLSKATGPRPAKVPLPTSPRRTTGSMMGVVAQAT